MAGAEFGPDSVCWVEELSFPKLVLAWRERDLAIQGPWQPSRWILFMGWGRAAGGCSHSTRGKGVQMPSYRQRACNKVEMFRL